MALIDLGVDVPVTSVAARALRRLAWAWTAHQAERARRVSLDRLLAMPDHRLRDLGLDRREIVAAVEMRHWPSRK